MTERTQPWAIITMIAATLLNSTAQLMYKQAITTAGLNIAALLREGIIILGLLFYAASGVLLIISLRGGQASVLYPIYTLSFIWIGIGSVMFFHEHISMEGIIGMIVIITGIILINKEGTRKATT